MEKSISEIAEMSEIEIQDTSIETREQFKKTLAELISYLLDHNFEKLLWILYRIDVNEEKAKTLLSQHLPEAAPDVLADLIITRQQKKEEMKKHFNEAFKTDDDDELKW